MRLRRFEGGPWRSGASPCQRCRSDFCASVNLQCAASRPPRSAPSLGASRLPSTSQSCSESTTSEWSHSSTVIAEQAVGSLAREHVGEAWQAITVEHGVLIEVQ